MLYNILVKQNTLKFIKGILLLHFIIGSRSGSVIKVSLAEGDIL